MVRGRLHMFSQAVGAIAVRNWIQTEAVNKVWMGIHPTAPVIPDQKDLAGSTLWLSSSGPRNVGTLPLTPVSTSSLCRGNWQLALSDATLLLHAGSTFSLTISLALRYRPNGNKPMELAPFPGKLYLASKSSRLQSDMVISAKNGHPEGTGCGKPSRDGEQATLDKWLLCASRDSVLQSSWTGPN